MRDLSDYILGIDVSSVSLKAAARRSVYDKLEHMDIVHGLAKIRLAFDALLMGDVVPYFSKDLGMVLKRAARVLRAEGVLLLSFDIHSSSKDYVLQPTGRWTFSESHIKNVAAESGFTVALMSYLDTQSRTYSNLASSALTSVRTAIYGLRHK